jgi:hypothetical protein
MSADDVDLFDRTELRLWCHHNARYGLPTKELVEWLREYIGGREAIEIGSGAGDLAYHLGIKATDNKMQDDPTKTLLGPTGQMVSVKEFYQMTGQPTIKYPDWVEKIEALDAVDKYKPQVVVAQWVTHWIDPNKPVPPGGGNVFGIKEDELLAKGVTYIMIGNRKIHGGKPILKLPHKEYQFSFLRSRRNDSDDVVYIWEK